MSITFVRRIIEVFIGLFVIAGIIAIIRAIAAAASGAFGSVSLPITTDTPTVTQLASDGLYRWTHGMITVTGQPVAHLLEIATRLAGLALLVIAMLALRKLLLALATGDLFTDANIALLRKIGIALLAVCALSVVKAVVLQTVVLNGAQMPEGFVLHPSISWNVDDVTNIWLDYSVPIWTFILGALALLTGEAFKSGKAYREDSESVV